MGKLDNNNNNWFSTNDNIDTGVSVLIGIIFILLGFKLLNDLNNSDETNDITIDTELVQCIEQGFIDNKFVVDTTMIDYPDWVYNDMVITYYSNSFIRVSIDNTNINISDDEEERIKTILNTYSDYTYVGTQRRLRNKFTKDCK